MILGPSVLELSSGQHFMFPCPGDLDLWPTDLKNNRLPLLIITKLPMKFHDPRTKRSWVIIRNNIWWTYRQTDRPTDRPTDICKTIYPPHLRWGGIMNSVIKRVKCTWFGGNKVQEGKKKHTQSKYNFSFLTNPSAWNMVWSPYFTEH